MYTRNNQRAQRYNKTGTFVPSSQQQLRQSPLDDSHQQHNSNFVHQQQQQQNQQQPQQQQQQPVYQSPEEEKPFMNVPLPPFSPQEDLQEQIMNTDNGQEELDSGDNVKPKKLWTKPQGVVKLSNKERRLRQNKRLSRILIPKNALMILNEMNQGELDFSVEQLANNNAFSGAAKTAQFVATLKTEGNEYKGYAVSKNQARTDAAEQAIRDLVLKKMVKQSEAEIDESNDMPMSEVGDAMQSDDDVPILKLASYALHKLFLEWQAEGFKIPIINKPLASRGTSIAGSDIGDGTSSEVSVKVKKPKALPADAAQIHPCMLLAQMRQKLEYQEINIEGDRPQNMMFTMGINVDGTLYLGKGSNKKEARKNAARSACQAVFGIQYAEESAFTQRTVAPNVL